MNVSIVPVRGVSKRIPRKNIKNLMEKSMMAYSINAAIDSGCSDRVIVNTDDIEMALVEKYLGAEFPFIRPDSLSNDQAATVPVIKHAFQYLIEQGKNIEIACCIYATAPSIRAKDLDKVIKSVNKFKGQNSGL